jgi:penicillin-binding protein 2
MEMVVHRGNQVTVGWHRISTSARIEVPDGGKSGTAQVVGIKQGEATAKRNSPKTSVNTRGSSVAPADAPEIAVAVLVENGGGGSAGAGRARRIDAQLLPNRRGGRAGATSFARYLPAAVCRTPGG